MKLENLPATLSAQQQKLIRTSEFTSMSIQNTQVIKIEDLSVSISVDMCKSKVIKPKIAFGDLFPCKYRVIASISATSRDGNKNLQRVANFLNENCNKVIVKIPNMPSVHRFDSFEVKTISMSSKKHGN